MYQFVCDRNAMYDAGKEDYLHRQNTLDWIGLAELRDMTYKMTYKSSATAELLYVINHTPSTSASV